MELTYINCKDRLPEEFIPKNQTEPKRSNWVLVWDTFYGPSIDRLWDGQWQSDINKGNIIEPAVCHEKLCWAEIPLPECMAEYEHLFKLPKK